MRPLPLLLAPLLTTSALAQTPSTLERPPAGRQYVAMVVGLSSYQNLPDEVELNFGRSDAALVAAALREEAGFGNVYLLTDREASREGIRETLRTRIAQVVGPDDVLVIYFVGHGIGADLGIPTLLAYDSTLENGQEDGLVLEPLARDIQTWNKSGTTLIVTDAIHRNQLDGIYFYGPAATQWPQMPSGTMVLSSSQAEQPGTDGAFGRVFAAAIAGAADINDDTYVTASELQSYLIAALTPSGQVPVASGDYSGHAIFAAGVDRTKVRAGAALATEGVYPDVTIDKAKFVFREGAAQGVRCVDRPLVSCDPSCYVWDLKAGPCEVTAVIDGVPMKGRVILLDRGRYECRRQGPELACKGPT